MVFCNTIYNVFFFPKLVFQRHLHKIYVAFYLLTWAFSNDVNVYGYWNVAKIKIIFCFMFMLFFRLEGHVTIRKFLTPLWNEGKRF